MWKTYYTVNSLEEALRILDEQEGHSRIVAGATDLIPEFERGVRGEIDNLVDITRVPGLDRIILDEDDIIHLGPLVTHNHCIASKLVRERAFPLARASWEVGAPQIRNRGTVAGNLITASPANDTISPLIALNSWVVLASPRGERKVMLTDFYTGVRKTVMQADEMLVDIAIPALNTNRRSKHRQFGTFIKLALRRAQGISVVNVAIVLEFKSDIVASAAITLGAVAPTIIHAVKAENYLKGKTLTEEIICEAARLAMESSCPIDDIRSSATYRREMVRVCTGRGLRSLLTGEGQSEVPSDPVLLWGQQQLATVGQPVMAMFPKHPIESTINGKKYLFKSGYNKTLLHLLRDEAGLTGSKEGCAEGECGACTVFLDGKAVMACLVPAPRAHGAEIVTVEGLAVNGKLHPVQRAFIENGAVQCGYCTPGFLMSAAKLLEEIPQPNQDEIEQAISGNLCRCTGYYKIVQAIEDASKQKA